MKTVRVRPHRRAVTDQEKTLAHFARERRKPATDRELRSRHWRKFSALDRGVVKRLIDQTKSYRRSGFTYTGLFKFDIDDMYQMQHTYNRLGDRVMYAVASTNRRVEDFDVDDALSGKTHGVSMWRDGEGHVYVDDVDLLVGIDDAQALRLAAERGQFAILKIDGRTRSFAFLEAPGFDVTIRGRGAERTFEPRPEGL